MKRLLLTCLLDSQLKRLHPFSPPHLLERAGEGSPKRYLIAGLIFFSAYFFTLSATAANYAIELNNGAVFITDHYWEEGSSIKCFLFEGIAGFDKQYIHSITKTILETEKPYIELETPGYESADSMVHKTPTEDSVNIKNQEPVQTESDQSKKDIYISITEQNHFLDRRDEILKKIRTAKNEIQTAKKQGIAAKKRQFEKDFIALNNEYRKLFNEVLEANNGTPPSWWPAIWTKDTKF